MAVEVIMPVLGMTMESGVIVEWMKQEGDTVSEGDVLFTVETDKSVMEVEAKVTGTLLKILNGPGDEIPIQQIIAYIGSPDDEIPAVSGGVEAETSGSDSPVIAAIEQNGSGAGSITTPSIKPDRIKASPKAKKRARGLSISLDQITGTGPGGRIVFSDVEAYAATQATSSAAAGLPLDPASKQISNRTPLSGIRKIGAKRLAESTSTIPHFYLTMSIDMTRATELRQELLSYGDGRNLARISINDLLIKAAGLALQDNPAVNASLDGNTVEQYTNINVGFAVALEDGLVVPVVPSANLHSVYRIAEITKSLDTKAKEGGLAPEDYGHGTFTISNLGMFGVDQFTAIINPPEAAILAVGQVKKQPVVVDDDVVIRSMMSVTLSSDHRLIDGAIAAQFLARFKAILEEPLALLISH
jgi:pyruvate dehydrogenase E2 component (dihydrolipoamide acetyltransferase)